MTDTARNIEPLDPASTDGMADLFEPLATSAQHSTDQSPATPDQGITIDQAAGFLRVSPRTILRRLQKGTLPGFKVQGQFGLEWRVSPLTIPAQHSADLGLPTSVQCVATPIQSLTTSDQSDPELIKELRQQISDLKNELDKKISEAQREIQAAAFRNGYLESQLENHKEEIKLLTDSQHKPGWWDRFKQVFVKQ